MAGILCVDLDTQEGVRRDEFVIKKPGYFNCATMDILAVVVAVPWDMIRQNEILTGKKNYRLTFLANATSLVDSGQMRLAKF